MNISFPDLQGYGSGKDAGHVVNERSVRRRLVIIVATPAVETPKRRAVSSGTRRVPVPSVPGPHHHVIERI
jgi:hypothetical protein